MKLEPKIGKKAEEIFEKAIKENAEYADRGFAIVKEIPDDSILFIGLNPSFPKNEEIGNHFYPLEQNAGGYFAKFKAIADVCDSKWSHFDLLAVRETNQKNVEMLEYSNLKFICDQLFELAKPVLKSVKPKAVIVVNSLSRKYLGKDKIKSRNINLWLNFDFEFKPNNGAYYVTNSENLKDVPFFFSGMLTGQRALDLGSYERLKWHVSKVVNGELKP